MRFASFVAIAAVLSSAFAQDAPKPMKPKGRLGLGSGDGRPVTESEAAAAFKKTRVVLSKAIERQIPGGVEIPSGNNPATREQVVAEFSREVAGLSPKFKFTPLPVSFDPSVVKIGAGQKSNLLRLIQMGFVGKVAPLATGPADGLTPSEFGDALGFFIARVAQVTHLPDPKWSPMLGAGRGG